MKHEICLILVVLVLTTCTLRMRVFAHCNKPGNIGEEHALFEPAHGSAPDIAGQGIGKHSRACMVTKGRW